MAIQWREIVSLNQRDCRASLAMTVIAGSLISLRIVLAPPLTNSLGPYIFRHMANYRNKGAVAYYLLALKALSDENRLRALVALRSRELCQCQVVELLELAPSTVSKHLSILKQAGLIESRKVGRWIYFRSAETEPGTFENQLAELVATSAKKTELIKTDRKRIKEILCIDPECLCESQRVAR